MPNLDEVRLKTVSQLSEDDKTFLNQNVDKLTDEDKEAYSSVLSVSETPVTPEAPATPEIPATPETPYTFKSEEDAKAFVTKQLDEKKKKEDQDAKDKQAAIDAAKTPEEKKYVEDTWKPKNWNEGIKTAAEAAADIVEQRQKAKEKETEENGKRLAREWGDVSKENKIPSLETKEGRSIHDQVVKLALQHGKTNFKDAYQLWSQTPKEFGGGYDPIKVAEKIQKDEAEKKEKAEAEERRKAAAKIGGQNQGAGSIKGSGPLKPMSYEDMKKGRNKVIKEALNG